MNLSDSVSVSNDSNDSNNDTSPVSGPPSSGVRRKTATTEFSAAVRASAEHALLTFLVEYGFGQNEVPEKARRFLNKCTAPLAFGRPASAERVKELLGDEHPLLGQPTFELHAPRGEERPARSCLVFVTKATVNGRPVHQLAAKTVELYDDDFDDEDYDDEVN